MVLRQRRKRAGGDVVSMVQEMDAFPKVPDHYVERTGTGATVSLITLGLVVALVTSEFHHYAYPDYSFSFRPDGDFASKLTLSVDLTVAMLCEDIGADVIDSTGENSFNFGKLATENTWFELDRLQRRHFEAMQNFNAIMREQMHEVQHALWKEGPHVLYGEIPPRRHMPEDPHDACRIHGSLEVNKVAGNLHVTAGQTVPLLRGHVHLSSFLSERDYNFSHRIDKFSFGSPHAGIVQPLEGDEKIADENLLSFQYFLQVVPTEIVTGPLTFKHTTYQYSVKDQIRPAGGSSHPGIFFKYDMSALKVVATPDRDSLPGFLVRLCASAGGLVAVSQMICGWMKSAISAYCCKNSQERGSPKH